MAMPKKNNKIDPTEYRVPRNFKLLEELENAEKGKYTDAKKWGDACNWVNLGLDGQDATFTHWNCTIIPMQGGHIGDRIYTLKVKAGPGYPSDPPQFRFVQQVNMPCVNKTGIVQFNKLKNFEWHQERCLFEALLAIRKEMEPSAVAQACARIAQGKTY
mmetsp:Transcript_57455/g.51748  ORF Transcript_57455/g.51748 Transcript_57455/m.51748 type:complete len:159 (-) Transcript_57455:23-499(-)